MKVLKKAEIASSADRRPVAEPVPEWGDDCGIYLRLLSGREREGLIASVKGNESDFATAVLAVQSCACNEVGELLFATSDEVEATITDPVVVLRLGARALQLNRLLKTSLEDERKNS